MYVLACMLCLIWGCDALVLRRQEALVGPLMGIELSHHRGMLQGTFLLDAPHATHSHTHTLKVTNIYSAVKKKTQTKHWSQALGARAFYTKLACLERMQIQRPHHR